jgi:hypothetical protein
MSKTEQAVAVINHVLRLLQKRDLPARPQRA